MGDTILFGVLRMPYELAMSNEISRHQYWQRGQQAADEIERLRDALRHYVSECDCNGGTYYEDDHITGKTLVKDCPKCEQARAALGEGSK